MFRALKFFRLWGFKTRFARSKVVNSDLPKVGAGKLAVGKCLCGSQMLSIGRANCQLSVVRRGYIVEALSTHLNWGMVSFLNTSTEVTVHWCIVLIVVRSMPYQSRFSGLCLDFHISSFLSAKFKQENPCSLLQIRYLSFPFANSSKKRGFRFCVTT
jgi:hypothetical protein